MISERVDRIADRMGVNRATVIRYALDRMLPEIEREGIVLRPAGVPRGERAVDLPPAGVAGLAVERQGPDAVAGEQSPATRRRDASPVPFGEKGGGA